MVENLPNCSFNTVKELAELLDPVPDLGLHLDIGHANLLVERNTTEELVAQLGSVRHRSTCTFTTTTVGMRISIFRWALGTSRFTFSISGR